jgi:hypothetical protein
MNYKIVFEDGSESLMHFGVKGMKWGSWNAETRARYAGAGNGTYYKKAQRGDKYGRSVTDLRRKYNANQPKAKQIAKNVLLTPGGAHAYNTSRSRGLGRTESLENARLGVLYAQGVKSKQRKAGTTAPKLSDAAKLRSEYTKKESFGKSAAKTLLIGDIGSVAYDTVKASTKSRGKAAVNALITVSAPSVTRTVGGLAGLAVGGPVGSVVGQTVGAAAGVPVTYGTQYLASKKSTKQLTRKQPSKK